LAVEHAELAYHRQLKLRHYICIYVYTYVCVCACVRTCVCAHILLDPYIG
jgi:hypothetical protein